MNRPINPCIVRDGKLIPLELAPMAGDFRDGYEHWSAATRIDPDDRMQVAGLCPALVVHFTNGYFVTAKVGHGPISFFRTEAYT